MAVNAMIQLYRVLGDDRASQLSRQILVFSVSHDKERVKVYGHYAVTEGATTTCYRYPIESFLARDISQILSETSGEDSERFG